MMGNSLICWIKKCQYPRLISTKLGLILKNMISKLTPIIEQKLITALSRLTSMKSGKNDFALGNWGEISRKFLKHSN